MKPKLSENMEFKGEAEQPLKLRIITLLTSTRTVLFVVPIYSSLLYSEKEYG
jgi:hypothetical protein